MMLALFVAALGLSLAYCAPPGPVLAESLRRGLLRGTLPLLHFQFGALAASLLWVAAGLAGAAVLAEHRQFSAALSGLGVLLLARLAWRVLADAWSGRPPARSRRPERGDWLDGALLTLASPFALTFALGTGSLTLGSSATPARAGVYMLGFFLGSLAYRTALVALIASGRRAVTATRLRWVNALCGLALAAFTIRLLAGSLVFA